MSAAESTKTLAGRPWPNGDPSTWVYINELPTPPEVEQEVEETCRQNGWTGFWRWWHRRDIEFEREHAKCVHYFLHKRIVYRNAKRGKLVMMVGERESPEIWEFLLSIPPEERSRISGWYVYTGPYYDWYHIWGDQDEA